jgi:dihydroxyacetone kinase-like protein
LSIGSGDEVLVMVTGLGGTPQQELYGFYLQVHRLLEQLGGVVLRSLVGNYVTSLDMAGAAVTLMHLDDELLRLWDAPVCTAEFRW